MVLELIHNFETITIVSTKLNKITSYVPGIYQLCTGSTRNLPAMHQKLTSYVPEIYLRKISIHETLISRSICLLWAKIASDTHSSISNPTSAWWVGCSGIRCVEGVPDAAVCVAGDLGPEEAYAS